MFFKSTILVHMPKYITKSAKETQKLGENFARYLSSPRKRGSRVSVKILDSRLHGNDNLATVLALQGDLGAGKTSFLQGFAKGLGIEEKILSPTFVIMKRFGNFYHFDCYRINKPEEILELGFKEIVSNPKNIVAIEWPEKIKKYLPKEAIKIKFKFIDEQTRELTFNI